MQILLSVPWRLSTSGVRVGTLSRRPTPAPSYTGGKIPPVVGLSWQVVSPSVAFPPTDETWIEKSEDELHTLLAHHAGEGIIQVPDTLAESCLDGVTLKTYVALGNGVFYVPLESPASRARKFVPEQDMMSFGLTESFDPGSFVTCDVNGVQRYFRLDTGRTWLDCEAEEIDHIYYCQRFGVHDCFMIYASKGRLLLRGWGVRHIRDDPFLKASVDVGRRRS